MKNSESVFLSYLKAALWGDKLFYEGRQHSHNFFLELMRIAQEQALVGLISQTMIDSGARLEREDALNMFALQQYIRRQNHFMNDAVIDLCDEMKKRNIRIFVFKGQSLACYYQDKELRQSGDIDFYCHYEDWGRAIDYFKKELNLPINNLFTEKDVEFSMNGVAYEMHNKLTIFSNPWYNRYWSNVVMPDILSHPYSVDIDGHDIPTLSPTLNVLYVFVHLFRHLTDEGIGLRQFCDWAILLSHVVDENALDKALLEKHLKGIGLKKAFIGLGAILTDYLGFPEDKFPFIISDNDHAKADYLLKDIFEKGNFGHNQEYLNKPGLKHGIEHLKKLFQQGRKFGSYAPNEVWWRIPYMFKWWTIKIYKMTFKKA